jgi:hypothetical protein
MISVTYILRLCIFNSQYLILNKKDIFTNLKLRMESYLDDDRYSEENKGDLQRDPSTAVQIQVGPTGQKIRSIAVT